VRRIGALVTTAGFSTLDFFAGWARLAEASSNSSPVGRFFALSILFVFDEASWFKSRLFLSVTAIVAEGLEGSTLAFFFFFGGGGASGCSASWARVETPT
jgi:hypothetical protein